MIKASCPSGRKCGVAYTALETWPLALAVERVPVPLLAAKKSFSSSNCFIVTPQQKLVAFAGGTHLLNFIIDKYSPLIEKILLNDCFFFTLLLR